MIGKTLKGDHIQNVMNYKNLDVEKYLKNNKKQEITKFYKKSEIF